MRKIESLNEINNEYKYIIGLTPQDARVLKTSLKLLPPVALNQEEIQTLMKAVDNVATADMPRSNDTFNNIENPNCEVCDD
tara:strand:- start:228 stop:470 length:243 start_codon:yes stop_codon:yes gene_type:complete